MWNLMKSQTCAALSLCVLIYLKLSFLTSPLYAMIDLEETAQDFVLSSERIYLSEFPHAFNPSIVRWHGKLLLSFRNIPNPRASFTSQIGLVWLNEDFTPASKPQLLDPQIEDPFISPLIPTRSEDGRLVLINDQLMLVYSDNKDMIISKAGFRVYVAEVVYQDDCFSLRHVEGLMRFEGESQQRREKNWTPFDYQGQLLLAYSLAPHRILRPIRNTGECQTYSESTSDIDWRWGELRGGTPALVVEGRFLAFFHSSKEMVSVQSQGKSSFHYFMGAYTYTLEPPFSITGMSPEPIVGKGFYTGNEYKPYWHPVNVVFPCGYVFDEQFIWVTYGKHDHEMWITKLDKKGLLESLVPVSPVLD